MRLPHTLPSSFARSCVPTLAVAVQLKQLVLHHVAQRHLLQSLQVIPTFFRRVSPNPPPFPLRR
jgi:predicted HD phosphohydrolase